ncbi:MAG: Hsp20/alpha crystallin family protein [Chloroflexota bacterium]
MSLVKFEPFRGFESIARRMNAMMSDFDKGFNIEYGSFSPRVDISEDEKKIYFHVELAGIKKEDVKVTINDDNVLIIKGEKRREERFASPELTEGNSADGGEPKEGELQTQESSRSYLRVERSFGEFVRSFMLPDNVNKDNISAKYTDGVLNIELEKIQPAPPKEIPVNID